MKGQRVQKAFWFSLLLCYSCDTPFLSDVRTDPVTAGRTTLVWTASDQTWTEMLVADSLLIYGTFDGFVVARNRFTGEERWRFATSSAGSNDGSVARRVRRIGDLVVWTRRNAYALDVRTGALRWKLEPIGSGFSGFGPAADSEQVYFYRGPLITSVRAADGSTVWEDSASAYDSPTNIHVAVAGDRILASRSARQVGEPQLLAMNKGTGEEVWNAWPMPGSPWPEQERCCRARIEIDDAVALVMSFGGEVRAHAISDGDVLWSATGKRPYVDGTVGLIDGLAVVASAGVVTGYDRLTGSERWEYTRAVSGTDPFIAVDGDRLGFCFQGTGTAIVDRRTGAALLEIEREPRNASRLGALRCLMGVGIKDDWLYHGTADGEIVGIRWGARSSMQ